MKDTHNEKLQDLAMRSGISYCLMIVRTKPKQDYDQQYYMDSVTRNFFIEILGKPIEELIGIYKSYAISCVQGMLCKGC